jgi:hypothetical protein
MRRFLIFLMLVIIATICFFYSLNTKENIKENNIYSMFGINQKSDLSLVFKYDFRSNEMNTFRISILNYLKNLDLKVNCISIDMATNKIYVNQTLNTFSKLNIFDDEYTYYLYDKNGKFVSKGSMAGSEEQVKYKVNILCNLINTYSIHNEISIGENIRNLPFLYNTVKDYFENNQYSCFVIYDNICFECVSGKLLQLFEEVSAIYYMVDFNYITVHNYSQKDIERFKSDGNIHINIIKAKNDLINEYFDTAPMVKNNSDHYKGLILILDNNGKVEIFSHKLDEVLTFLRSLMLKCKEVKK